MVPLIDLHRHLDGNIRPSTIFDIASNKGLPLATHSLESLKNLVYVQDKTSDLLAFLRKLDYGISVLTCVEDCYRVAYENVEDAFNEGLSYVELRFSPYYMSQAHKLDIYDVVEAVIKGVKAGVQAFGVKANLIGILSRSYGVQACSNELDAILAYKEHFVAVDLAGDELGFPATLFIPHFNRVHKAGLNVTVHAGEADGATSVWHAIKELGATRIGHGVNAVKDTQLMAYLAKKKIGIEACLTSNYQTGAWTNIKTHPVSTFLVKNIQVSLHTDDPGVSNITLIDEYSMAQSKLGFSTEQIETLKYNAIQQAFLSEAEKAKLQAS